MPRYHHIVDLKTATSKKVAFSPKEEADRDVQNIVNDAARPMEYWEQAMAGTDKSLSRFDEDIMNLLIDKGVVTMSDFPQTTKDNYDAKKALRAKKP